MDKEGNLAPKKASKKTKVVAPEATPEVTPVTPEPETVV